MADAVSSGIMITGIGLIVLAASVAAGAGLFIGVRAAVIAIAKAIRRGREKRRIRKLAEDKSAKEDWVYVNRPDEDEEAFMREMEAEAAEAEAEQMLLTGGEGNE
jgi:RNase P protein component